MPWSLYIRLGIEWGETPYWDPRLSLQKGQRTQMLWGWGGTIKIKICQFNNSRPGYERNCEQVRKAAVDHIWQCQLLQHCMQGDESPVIATMATVELVSDEVDPLPSSRWFNPNKVSLLGNDTTLTGGWRSGIPSLHTESYVAISSFYWMVETMLTDNYC